MWRTITSLPLLIGLGWFSAEQTVPPAGAESGYAALVTMDRAIDPVSARHLARAINTAAAEGAQLIVITINTPGGLLDSTRAIVQSILGSTIPTVVYVAPAGARAASAGTFVTAAANFAVKLVREGDQVAMFPVYDEEERLVSVRFRSGEQQVAGLKESFEGLWSCTRPLVDLWPSLCVERVSKAAG